MTDLAAAIRTPLEYECTDGEVRKMSYIGGRILCEFSVWINRQQGREARHLVTMGEISTWSGSPVGMRWLLWRSMKDVNKPAPTEEQVGDLVKFYEWDRLVFDLLDMPKKSDGDGDDESDPT
jgi:hypothetical protein